MDMVSKLFSSFLQKLSPYQKICKYVLKNGDKVSSIYLGVISRSWQKNKSGQKIKNFLAK